MIQMTRDELLATVPLLPKIPKEMQDRISIRRGPRKAKHPNGIQANKKGQLVRVYCMDCRRTDVSHIEMDYMVWREIWDKAYPNSNGEGSICVPCLEKRLGRKLIVDDFPLLPVNILMIERLSGTKILPDDFNRNG